ncbi:MAG: efflux RND transporter periplasmic adaptor subunit [Chlamydiae bacterium]|nr:efflux RND transporter periplasmic adaptor subunit [Chlamydiota bacterium]
MLRKYLLPTIALFGALIGLVVVFWSEKKENIPPILYPPSTSPYKNAVYGSGMIEASTENIAIGTPFIEPLTNIYVVEGDMVKKGDPLLKLDTRLLEAECETASAQLSAAIINFENLQNQYSFYERLTDRNAVSEQAYSVAYYGMREAEEQVRVAEAQLGQILTNIERSTVRAPVDGQILQVNAHIGEIYPTTSYNTTKSYVSLQTSLILMGAVAPMQMRIDIDEEDSWRFIKGSRATAFVRGNSRINFPMEFLRIEPYIIPKTSFTGETIERIDTRVFQVLYRFERKDLPVYPGQLLDVYIEAAPNVFAEQSDRKNE